MQGKVQIDWKLCQICVPCEARLACAPKAIVRLDPDDPPYVMIERCLRCGDCIPACPYSAVRHANDLASDRI